MPAILNKFPYILQAVDNIELLKEKIDSEDVSLKVLIDSWNIEKDIRFKYLKEVITDWVGTQNKKLIIFDPHPLTLNNLASKFKEYKPLVIHGRLNDSREERNEKYNSFNDIASENKLLFVSSKVGGASRNLHFACNRLISWSLPYDTTLYRQLIDRIYRITSTENAIIENLILNRTVDNFRYLVNTGRLILNDLFLKQEMTREKLKDLLIGRIT
jgi:hypothetical protein